MLSPLRHGYHARAQGNQWLEKLYNSPFLPGLLSTRLFNAASFQKNAQMYYSLTTFVKSLRVSKLFYNSK
jgi:hypothetical protein